MNKKQMKKKTTKNPLYQKVLLNSKMLEAFTQKSGIVKK